MSQIDLDSYENTGLGVALALVNGLVVDTARSGELDRRTTSVVLREALGADPPSVSALREAHHGAFMSLARRLHEVFALLNNAEVARAAELLNRLLERYPANPHLAEEDGVWRMHHHPAKAGLAPMWSSICAEALARMIGHGHAPRAKLCEDETCARAFIDTSKNRSGRYCSVRCQNRVKVAAYRSRHKRR